MNISTWRLADRVHSARIAELENRKRNSFGGKRRETECLEAVQFIAERYAGLIIQIAMRGGLVGNSSDDKGVLESLVTRSFLKLRDGTYGNASRSFFSATFWRCLIAQLKADVLIAPTQLAAVKRLKPRFMLRQFVDQMPNGSARTLLRVAIYAPPGPRTFVTSSEVRRELPGAYGQLHETLLRSVGRIAQLTENSIDDAKITNKLSTSSIVTRLYENWLEAS